MIVGFGASASLRMLVQRQGEALPAVELLFEEVGTMHFKTNWPDSDNIIFGATLCRVGDWWYWADDEGWTPDHPRANAAGWISARKVSWRDASLWIGETLRLGPGRRID